MPVRSLNSRVLKWPKAAEVEAAAKAWAHDQASRDPAVLRIGYFGSLARGDWGVGSDLDLLVVLERSDLPFEERGRRFDTAALPVPADLLVYTKDELDRLKDERPFHRHLLAEVRWLYQRAEAERETQRP